MTNCARRSSNDTAPSIRIGIVRFPIRTLMSPSTRAPPLSAILSAASATGSTVSRTSFAASSAPQPIITTAPTHIATSRIALLSPTSSYPPRGYPARAVARDWHHLFVCDHESVAPDAPDPGLDEERRRGFFGRLRESMRKTREALAAEVQATLFEGDLDEATWERLEEALIYADVGARTTAQVVEKLEREAEEGELTGGEALTARLAELLAELARTGDDTIDIRPEPAVILVVGVNGTGKTTTIGKLAWHLRHTLGQRVVVGAADTFRAAAVEQLERWAERADVELVKGPEGSDPGAVAFDAVARARQRGADVVIIDTAGRLHTQHNLMEELTKVRRVITKQMPDAPHETLMTVDATTGQNGIRQAKLFGEAVSVTGIVLTKLDGTAKGGIALVIANELGIHVKLIGIGEQLEDLRPFDPDDFAKALLTA